MPRVPDPFRPLRTGGTRPAAWSDSPPLLDGSTTALSRNDLRSALAVTRSVVSKPSVKRRHTDASSVRAWLVLRWRCQRRVPRRWLRALPPARRETPCSTGRTARSGARRRRRRASARPRRARRARRAACPGSSARTFATRPRRADRDLSSLREEVLNPAHISTGIERDRMERSGAPNNFWAHASPRVGRRS